MEGFTLVDAGVAGIIVLSAILAYSRGFVRESLAIAGWIGAAVLAYAFAAKAQPLVKELPVVGKFLQESCELSLIAAFAAEYAAMRVSGRNALIEEMLMITPSPRSAMKKTKT